MKKGYSFLMIIMLVISLCGCTTRVIAEDENMISYEEYLYLFNKLNSELILTDYENLGGNQGVQLVYIDEEISFGKRNYLTLDNKMNNQSLQQRIEYMETSGKSLVVIDLVYLDKTLDNDLVYWSNPLVNNSENEFMRNKYTENIISYGNLLIKISLFATPDNEIDASMLTRISKEVVDYIQNLE